MTDDSQDSEKSKLTDARMMLLRIGQALHIQAAGPLNLYAGKDGRLSAAELYQQTTEEQGWQLLGAEILRRIDLVKQGQLVP